MSSHSFSKDRHLDLAAKTDQPRLRDSHFKGITLSEALEPVRQSFEQKYDYESHAGKVHILMENGKPCDKWIDATFEAKNRVRTFPLRGV